MPRLPPVLILYNTPDGKKSEAGSDTASDAGVLTEVSAVERALDRLGARRRTAGVSRLAEIHPVLSSALEEHVVFNLVENLAGNIEDYNFVPAVCNAFGKSATGSDTACMLLTLDKWRSKVVLKAAGLPVPEGFVVSPAAVAGTGKALPVRIFSAQAASGGCIPKDIFPGPYIIKPAVMDASEGIEENCVFPEAGRDLEKGIEALHGKYGHPVLVEQFVGNREFNVSLLETASGVKVLPPAEIEFAFPPGKARVVGYTAKWKPDSFEYRNTRRVIPANLDKETTDRLRELARSAWDAVACRDYARVDMRMNEGGNIFILEVNANPDVSPEAGFAAALKAGGIEFHDFVRIVVENAWKRLAAVSEAAETAGESPAENGICRTMPRHRDAVLDFVEETGFFPPGEFDIAREVLDDAVVKGADGHYQSYVYILDGKPVGWVCFGPTPCTVGTFDIYWIVVAPGAQGRGIGGKLMKHAEELVIEKGGRQCVAETSGRKLYDSTRGFYLKLGYTETARIPDFYAQGDDKVIFARRLVPA